MSSARCRRSASHAAGTHGWLPQKTGWPGLRRGGVSGYNLHIVPPVVHRRHHLLKILALAQIVMVPSHNKTDTTSEPALISIALQHLHQQLSIRKIHCF